MERWDYECFTVQNPHYLVYPFHQGETRNPERETDLVRGKERKKIGAVA
jgi:hypothetical protein